MNRNLSGSILREASRQRVVDMYFCRVCVCYQLFFQPYFDPNGS